MKVKDLKDVRKERKNSSKIVHDDKYSAMCRRMKQATFKINSRREWTSSWRATICTLLVSFLPPAAGV